MLYQLLYPLHTEYSFLNVFRYITFRTGYAVLTALVISFVIGPWLIERLKKAQVGQQIREEGPRSHLHKAGTPTMGGLMILLSSLLASLLWMDLRNRYVWLVLFALAAFGLIGFVDDALKYVRKRSMGLRPRFKFLLQILVALAIIEVLYVFMNYSTQLSVPFFKNVRPDLGWLYIPFAVVVIVGASNAVNLTDGLDGLAIGPVSVAAVAYTIVAYISGHKGFRPPDESLGPQAQPSYFESPHEEGQPEDRNQANACARPPRPSRPNPIRGVARPGHSPSELPPHGPRPRRCSLRISAPARTEDAPPPPEPSPGRALQYCSPFTLTTA